jgi:hypothetical protein
LPVIILSNDRHIETRITGSSGRELIRPMASLGFSGRREASSILPLLESDMIRPADAKNGVCPEPLTQCTDDLERNDHYEDDYVP